MIHNNHSTQSSYRFNIASNSLQLQELVIIHDDDKNDIQLKQNDDGIISSTDPLTKRLRKGDDGVQEKVRLKWSSEGIKETTNKLDVIGQHICRNVSSQYA